MDTLLICKRLTTNKKYTMYSMHTLDGPDVDDFDFFLTKVHNDPFIGF